MQVLNEMYGAGRIISYISGTGEVYDWENRRRKGKTCSAVVRNCLNKQFRRGNGRTSKEAQINKTALVKEASSKDGAVFIAVKTDHSFSAYESKFFFSLPLMMYRVRLSLTRGHTLYTFTKKKRQLFLIFHLLKM